MSKSLDSKTTEIAAASGTAKRLEEVLDNLDLKTIGAPLLRTLLAQTIETLKIARRRVDEQQNHLELLSQLSTTDPATGLLNTRGLHLILRRALARARRDETGGILIVIDLHGFKAINDSYGHAAGDKALSSIARHLVSAVWEGDEVARLGSDKFAILMPGISRREADVRASSLSTGLNGLIVPWGGKAIQIRCSVSGACYGPTDDFDMIYQRADEKMYHQENDHMSIRTTNGKHDA
jgi:diguanylate cyclase (GGDEF)-like protein